MPSFAPAQLKQLSARIEQEIDDGTMLAAQLAIGFENQIVAAMSFGEAVESTRFKIFSATKPLVAMALLPYLADGSLDLTTPIAHYIPEFGHHEKFEVTVLQVLTMQGGFPNASIPRSGWGSSELRRQHFAQWSLDYSAGTITEYHPTSAHWVIAELLEQLSGRNYADVVHDSVVAPAGVPHVLGAEVGKAFTVRLLGERPDIVTLADTFGTAALVPEPNAAPEALLTLNDPHVLSAGIPGGGGVASAAHMASIYQRFLHNSDQTYPAVWLADALSTIRNCAIDHSDKVPANRTIAGYVAGNDGFHLHRWLPALPHAFGHHDAGGQICWLDPASGVSVCFLNDTIHQDPRVQFRRAADLNGLVLDLLA